MAGCWKLNSQWERERFIEYKILDIAEDARLDVGAGLDAEEHIECKQPKRLVH